MQRHFPPNALPVLFALLLIGSGAALIALGQRASHPVPPPYSLPPSASIVPTKRKPSNTDWQSVLNRWIAALTSPSAPGGTVIRSENAADTSPLPVLINIGTIAARHPSWQLAAALERNPTLPINFEAIQIPAVEVGFSATLSTLDARVGTSGSLRRLPAPAMAASLNGEEIAFPRLAALEAETHTVSGLAELQAEAQSRQLRALDEFLVGAGHRQQQARAESAEIGLVAMEEEMEMARRLRLDALIAPLPPDAVQLRMINLRLQLLQSIFSTPEERDAARAELAELEEQWRQRLQEQAAERVAQLLALREQQEQSEQQSRTRFAASLIQKNERDAQARQAIHDSHTARVQADFTAANAILSIILPAVAAPSTSPATSITDRPSRRERQSTQVRSISGGSPSINIPPIARSSGQTTGTSMPGVVLTGNQESALSNERAQLIRTLRAQAWRESWRWSGLVARRNNWSWVQQPRNADIVATDKTSEVMAVLSFY